jgi:hypothetical protein
MNSQTFPLFHSHPQLDLLLDQLVGFLANAAETEEV